MGHHVVALAPDNLEAPPLTVDRNGAEFQRAPNASELVKRQHIGLDIRHVGAVTARDLARRTLAVADDLPLAEAIRLLSTHTSQAELFEAVGVDATATARGAAPPARGRDAAFHFADAY